MWAAEGTGGSYHRPLLVFIGTILVMWPAEGTGGSYHRPLLVLIGPISAMWPAEGTGDSYHRPLLVLIGLISAMWAAEGTALRAALLTFVGPPRHPYWQLCQVCEAPRDVPGSVTRHRPTRDNAVSVDHCWSNVPGDPGAVETGPVRSGPASVATAVNTTGGQAGVRECAGCGKRITERFLLKDVGRLRQIARDPANVPSRLLRVAVIRKESHS
uniref:Uncharacterized protein n=1 Tax=Timema cristinae TaxID=61476 RepID=A0A7R9H6H5_TIMCR|nr:unnamed protein product [Timema cristinae]